MGFVCVGRFSAKIPGICEVFVRPGISNYVSGSLQGLYRFGLSSAIAIVSVTRE